MFLRMGKSDVLSNKNFGSLQASSYPEVSEDHVFGQDRNEETCCTVPEQDAPERVYQSALGTPQALKYSSRTLPIFSLNTDHIRSREPQAKMPRR